MKNGKIAIAMKGAYEGFVKLCGNDMEVKSILAEVERKFNLQNPLDISSYEKKVESLQQEIEALQSKISDGEGRLVGFNKEFDTLNNSSPSNNIGTGTEEIWNIANAKIQQLNNESKCKIEALENEKSMLLSKLKSECNNAISVHREKSRIASADVDAYSEKAMSFYTEFVNIEETWSSSTKEEQEKATKALNKNSVYVAKMSDQIKDVTAEYAPSLNKLQSEIDRVYAKYKNALASHQDEIVAAQSERDSDITMAENARSSIVSSYANQISNLQGEFIQVDTDYSNQIRQAKIEDRATTRLNTSRTSKLSAINIEITKCGNKRDAELSKQDNIIETIKQKHAKRIAPLQKTFDSVLAKQTSEVSPLQNNYSSVKDERDTEIARIQNEINEANNKLANIQNTCKSKITALEQTRQQCQSDLLNRMTQYAMGETTELDRLYQEALLPFNALDEQKSQWETAVKKASSFRLAPIFEKTKNSIENKIKEMDYNTLTQIASASKQAYKPSSVLALLPVAGIVLALAIALSCIMIFFVKNISLAVLLPVIIIGGVLFVYFKLTSGYIDTSLTYDLLIQHYSDLASIRNHAKTQTENLEVSKLKEVGQKLYTKLIEADGVSRDIETKWRNDADVAAQNFADKINQEEASLNRSKDNIEKQALSDVHKINAEVDKNNTSFGKRKSNLEATINAERDTVDFYKDKLSETKFMKTDLEAKIIKLNDFAMYKEEYATLQKKVKGDAEKTYGEGNDTSLPNLLHFFGAKYDGEIDYVTEFNHNMEAQILLYKPFNTGTIAKNIENFLEGFLSEICYSADSGLVKRQFVIDVTSGAAIFDTKKYKDADITVVDEKALDKTVSELQKDCDVCKNASDEWKCSDFSELNQKLKQNRKNLLHYNVLHIIVPKRDQVNNASKLLSSAFKSLISVDDYKNNLLVLFYVSEDEWNAPSVIMSDDNKKEEDIIFFIKKLGNLNRNIIYTIDNENITLEMYK